MATLTRAGRRRRELLRPRRDRARGLEPRLAGRGRAPLAPAPPPTLGSHALAINLGSTEAVDAALAAAEAAGATILKPAETVFWGGYSGYFADPDGHPWEVAWNPGWPLDEHGHVQLP